MFLRSKIRESDKGRGSAEARWLRDSPYHWVDPDNWSEVDGGNQVNEATPHLERLPCQGDAVLLPGPSRVYSLELPRSRGGVEVAEVRLAAEEHDNASSALARWEWRAIFNEHRRQFGSASGSLTVK